MKRIDQLIDKTEEQPNGCIVYTGYRDKDGYGRVGGDERRAHRLAYTELVGPIPDGMLVCHRCDNPPCVNPDHLFLGTAKDNMQDKHKKKRNADVRGSRNPASKLTDQQVQVIHALYRDGITMAAIAERFGIGFQNVSLIVRGINRPDAYEAFHGRPPTIKAAKPRLTDQQVLAIRNSSESGVIVAPRFGISTAQVSRIRNGKRSGSGQTRHAGSN